MPNIIFCLMGPTASGKTDMACELVDHFPLEIISVDSAMIYRGMNIGTAKPDLKTLTEAPHHLIDILDPPESYSAATFCNDVSRLSKLIISRGKIPLLVGGTMMYFRALQEGLSELPQADETIRKELMQKATEKGWAFMHQNLMKIDTISAQRIHPNDTQRVLRALEVYHLTGKPLSEGLQADKKTADIHFVNLMLMPSDRAWLHQRIESRFETMLSQGLVEEVKDLLKQWPLTEAHPSMRTVGYRQVLSYLRGDYDYATLRAKGVAATRQLAKRQLTWLRHWPESHSFSAENPSSKLEIVAIMRQILDNFD
jgi:tRNA dimethylallyltransferase